MSKLMVSVSGIRGVVGKTFTPPVIQKFAAAFGLTMGKRIVVGRDTRVSGLMVESLVTGMLNSVGCDVISLGIAPTPTIQLAVENLRADGGLAITASHNPVEWNALKLIGPDGLFLDEELGKQVANRAEDHEFVHQDWTGIGKIEYYDSAIEEHQRAILDLPFIDVAALRKRKFCVALDCVNGAGSVFFPKFLKSLGCEVIEINTTPNGIFPHTPEPLPENLSELMEAAKSPDVDIAFATDPDADRLAIISEKAEPLVEEYTLAIAVDFILSKRVGKVVVNASTSLAIDDIADRYDVPVIRTKVGEAHVAKRMREEEAVIGGEGNGGVILPDIHYGRDAPIAAAIALQHLLEFGGPISELRQSLPQYVIAKMKMDIGDSDPDRILEQVKSAHEGEEISLIDGVKILREKSWIHLRKSNTEPIIRVYAEAQTGAEAESLADLFLSEISSNL
ncbi:MAG: phosphoglucosamine mutase [bacterium]